jgi:site-specific recombinase XerD
MIQALARITDLLEDRTPALSQAENWQRARDFKWEMLEAGHVEIIKSKLHEAFSDVTANKLLAALRGVARTARVAGRMSAETYQNIKLVKLLKANPALRGRGLSTDELEALAEVCRDDKTLAGRRDAAVLAVAYGAGLRRFEIVALSVDDWDATDQSLKVKRGKGRKPRPVYLSPSGARAVNKWLEARGPASGQSPLFIHINKAGRITEREMSDQAIYHICRKRNLEAGIKRFSPHDMRRSFISDLLDAGADIAAVAGLAGHADINTTRKYDRRGERAKRAAALRLRVPF